jgi:hypothetical protein
MKYFPFNSFFFFIRVSEIFTLRESIFIKDFFLNFPNKIVNNSRVGKILIKALVIVPGGHKGGRDIGLSFHFIHDRFGFFFGPL